MTRLKKLVYKNRIRYWPVLLRCLSNSFTALAPHCACLHACYRLTHRLYVQNQQQPALGGSSG